MPRRDRLAGDTPVTRYDASSLSFDRVPNTGIGVCKRLCTCIDRVRSLERQVDFAPVRDEAPALDGLSVPLTRIYKELGNTIVCNTRRFLPADWSSAAR